MKKGLVSVIMAAYNAEGYISESIESIKSQTYPNWELIIINDCSTDKTVSIVQSFAKEDSRIKIIDNSVNLGLTKSLNVGIKQAEGEFIARLDADDLSEPTRFEKQVNYLNQHLEVALVGCAAFLINHKSKKIGVFHVATNRKNIDRLMLHVDPIIHSSMMIRKTAVDAVGGYRDKFKSAQDYDFVLRLHDRYPLANISEPLVSWRISEGSETMTQNSIVRVYADLSRNYAIERKKKGHDSYDSDDIDKVIKNMMEKDSAKYQSEYGVYKIFFMKKYGSGLIDLLKGTIRGGFPYNAFMRGIIQIGLVR
jgi:glycosyltransferase involved in cell wall biosynthesis